MRLPLANPLESRDGTLAKDSKIKNCIIEVVEGQPVVVKRPGVSSAVEQIPGGISQGLVSLGGIVYSVSNDILYSYDPSDVAVDSAAGKGIAGWGAGFSQFSDANNFSNVPDWDAGTSYAQGETVFSDGSVWHAVAASTGVSPGSTSASLSSWSRYASRVSNSSGTLSTIVTVVSGPYDALGNGTAASHVSYFNGIHSVGSVSGSITQIGYYTNPPTNTTQYQATYYSNFWVAGDGRFLNGMNDNLGSNTLAYTYPSSFSKYVKAQDYSRSTYGV